MLSKKKSVSVSGLCRFSYPFALGSFGGKFASLTEATEYLYREKRLEERLFFFENVFLPGIRKQKDNDFVVSILIGRNIPRIFLRKIKHAIRDIPQVSLVIEEEGQDPKALMSSIFTKMANPKAHTRAEFRLDDDDGVSKNFISSARKMALVNRHLIDKWGVVELDFNFGYFLEFGKEGVACLRVQKQHLICGQIILMRQNVRRTAANFRHYRMWEKNLSLGVPSPPMFIRSLHDHNDSQIGAAYKKKEVDLVSSDQEIFSIGEDFGVHLEQLAAAWTARSVVQ